jgi:hypothetical protein
MNFLIYCHIFPHICIILVLESDFATHMGSCACMHYRWIFKFTVGFFQALTAITRWLQRNACDLWDQFHGKRIKNWEMPCSLSLGVLSIEYLPSSLFLSPIYKGYQIKSPALINNSTNKTLYQIQISTPALYDRRLQLRKRTCYSSPPTTAHQRLHSLATTHHRSLEKSVCATNGITNWVDASGLLPPTGRVMAEGPVALCGGGQQSTELTPTRRRCVAGDNAWGS